MYCRIYHHVDDFDEKNCDHVDFLHRSKESSVCTICKKHLNVNHDIVRIGEITIQVHKLSNYDDYHVLFFICANCTIPEDSNSEQIISCEEYLDYTCSTDCSVCGFLPTDSELFFDIWVELSIKKGFTLTTNGVIPGVTDRDQVNLQVCSTCKKN